MTKMTELDDRPKGLLLATATRPAHDRWCDTELVGEDGTRYIKRVKHRQGIEPKYLCQWFRILGD